MCHQRPAQLRRCSVPKSSRARRRGGPLTQPSRLCTRSSSLQRWQRVRAHALRWRLDVSLWLPVVPGKRACLLEALLVLGPIPAFSEAQLLHALAGARGRLHVSEVDDSELGEGTQNPLERYPVGAAVRAVVLEQPSSRAVRCMVYGVP